MKRLVLLVLCALVSCEVFACAAITKKGTQCKRAPSPGSAYCWQHGGTTKAQREAGLTDADVAKMRCKAITKAGTQCKRKAATGSEYCWQHAGTQNSDKSASTPPTVDAPSAPSETQANTAVRVQCDAKTKKGVRCTRKAMPGGTKCWQHSK